MKRWISDHPLTVSVMAAVLIGATVFFASWWDIGIWESNRSDHDLEVTLSSRSGQKRGIFFSEAGRSSDQSTEESKAGRSSKNPRLSPERKRPLVSKAQVDSAGESQLEKALAEAAAEERAQIFGFCQCGFDPGPIRSGSSGSHACSGCQTRVVTNRG